MSERGGERERKRKGIQEVVKKQDRNSSAK